MKYLIAVYITALLLLASCSEDKRDEVGSLVPETAKTEEKAEKEIGPEFKEVLERLNQYYGTVKEEGYKNTKYGYEFNYPGPFFYIIEDGSSIEDYELSSKIELWDIIDIPNGDNYTMTTAQVRLRKIEEVPEGFIVDDYDGYQIMYSEAPKIDSSNNMISSVLIYVPEEELQLLFSIKALKYKNEGSMGDKNREQRINELQNAILETLIFDRKTFITGARSTIF